MSDIERLRAEARRLHKAAGSKASRLRSKGIEVGGSSADPRRDASMIKRYNKNQLQSYIKKLATFNDRSTKFAAGYKGAALPVNRLSVYAFEESKFNRRANRHYDSVKGTKLPIGDATVEQRDRDIRPKGRLKAQGDAVTRPYDPVERAPRMFKNADALEAAIADMRKRNSKRYLPDKLSKQRFQGAEMATQLGDNEIMELMSSLTDEQFDTVWNYSTLPNELSMTYEILELQARGKQERAHARVYSDSVHEIKAVLQWAKGLSPR